MSLHRREIHFSAPLRGAQLCPAPAQPSGANLDALRREWETAAFEKGRKEGERALGEQLIRQRNELMEMHKGVVESLRQAVSSVIRDSEDALSDLALELCKKVVADIPISAELIQACVREALAQADSHSELYIYLHPEDLAMLERAESPLLADKGSQPAFFHSSREVTRGGCLVKTKFGMVDARRESKLELLKEALAP